MAGLWKDALYAVRRLRKTPGFTGIALLTLALGIGVNTAMFSVVNQTLLHPAGISHPERVVAVRAKYDKLNLRNISVSVPDFADVLHSTDRFEAAALLMKGGYNYSGSGSPERLRSANVTYRWFDVFGARPALGRLFQADEDRPNANYEVVLSFAAWQRLFGQRSDIIGQSMDLDGAPYRIVGVMGPEFRWPVDADLWTPLGLADAQYTEDNRFNESYFGVARLRDGVSVEAADGFTRVLSDRVRNNGTADAAFARDSAWGMFLLPIANFMAGDTRQPMLILMAAVGFVLLIACANIAGLTLARASGRTRELAVRAALGATRFDLIRQSMAESLVLAAGGAVAGLAVAIAGVRGLLALAPAGSPIPVTVQLDPPMLLFTMLAALVTGLLCGAAPAWQISRRNQSDLLKEGGRSNSAGLARGRLRSSLVVAEVALALVLLVGAGLFLRSLAALEDVNPGFSPQGVVTATVALPRERYDDAAKQLAFYRAVLRNLAATPGVTTAAAGIPLPFSGSGGSASFEIDGRQAGPGDPGPHGDIGSVDANYFAALKIPLRVGRVFTEFDREGSQPVAIIDDLLARQYWPGENPIGKRLRNGRREAWSTIVGVVGHVRHSDLGGDEVKGKYYYPLGQQPRPYMSFLVRGPGDPGRFTAAIRDAVHAADPAQAVAQIDVMSDLVNSSLAPRRFVVTVLGVFAGMALAMALIGLYGVISYAVTQRTQELGVRMALGAQPSEILRLVLGQGMKLAVMGAAVGLGLSIAVGRLLESRLFHVRPFDPALFGMVAAALVGAALLAAYLPARRATKVDPLVALRYE